MRNISLLALATSLVLIVAACGEDSTPVSVEDASPEICHLMLGWDPWAPYQYLTHDDQVQGLDIDLVSAMAKGAGCEISFVQDNWVNLLNGIRNGDIDMLGGATRTDSREEFALFSDNYRHETFVLYVRQGESGQYADQSLRELLKGGFRIGITQDYIYGDQVSELQDDEKLSAGFVSVPITEVNYYNLVQGEIDGFLEDPFVAAYNIKRKGLQEQVEPHAI